MVDCYSNHRTIWGVFMKIDKIMQVLGKILCLVFTALEIFHGCLCTKKNVSSQQISRTVHYPFYYHWYLSTDILPENIRNHWFSDVFKGQFIKWDMCITVQNWQISNVSEITSDCPLVRASKTSSFLLRDRHQVSPLMLSELIYFIHPEIIRKP